MSVANASYLLDSNVLIYHAQKELALVTHALAANICAVASVSVIETLGYHLIQPQEKAMLQQILGLLPIIALDDAVIAKAIELRSANKMKLADSIIAASAICQQRILLTHNLQDFKHLAGLHTIDPLQSK